MIRFKPRASTRALYVHDSHTVPDMGEPERWKALIRQKGREMGLLDIGYHWLITPDAELVPCRPEATIGSHTPGQNLDTLSVCFIGGREEVGSNVGVDTFTSDMRRTLFRLWAELVPRYPGIVMKGHSEVQRYRNGNLPPCPPLDMDDLRREADLWLAGFDTLP